MTDPVCGWCRVLPTRGSLQAWLNTRLGLKASGLNRKLLLCLRSGSNFPFLPRPIEKTPLPKISPPATLQTRRHQVPAESLYGRGSPLIIIHGDPIGRKMESEC
jgi:hypothetical protein